MSATRNGPPTSTVAPTVRAWGQPGVELSADPRFARRIQRLAATSVLALGLIWLAAVRTEVAPPLVGLGFFAGWLLMPALLWFSLQRPRLRYALVVPSALVGVSLLAICLGTLPNDLLARTGWLLMTAGIWLGGLLGFWFWFRWLPVPAALDSPFAPGRWLLIGVHISCIVAGLLLVGDTRFWMSV